MRRSVTRNKIAIVGSLLVATFAIAEAPIVVAQSVEAKSAKTRTAVDIPMTEILDDPKKMDILRKHAASLANHPQLEQSRGMTLAAVAGYAESGLTEASVKAIVDDINKL